MSSAALAMVEPSGVATTRRMYLVWASTVRSFDPPSRSHQISLPSYPPDTARLPPAATATPVT